MVFLFSFTALLVSSCVLPPIGVNTQDKEQQDKGQNPLYKSGELTESKKVLHDYISKLAFEQSEKRLSLLKIATLDDINPQSTERQQAEFEALIYVLGDCMWIPGFEEANEAGYPFHVMKYDENSQGDIAGIAPDGTVLTKESRYNFRKGVVILVRGYATFKNRGDGLAVEGAYLTREFGVQKAEDLGLDITDSSQGDKTAEENSYTEVIDLSGQKAYATFTSKSYFHNTPNAATRRNAYLERDDRIYPLKEKNGFFYIEFTHPETRKSSKGWVLKSDFGEVVETGDDIIQLTPKSNITKVLSAPHPDSIHRNWEDGTIGLGWSFFGESKIVNSFGTFYQGTLITSRGNGLDGTYYVIASEWNE